MFTGLIEAVCNVTSVSHRAEAMRQTIDLGEMAKETKIGDSIAVNGVCLTVAKLQNNIVTFDISRETLVRSTLGRLRPLSAVNVERALQPNDRLGGHIVQGHVDGTAKITAIERQGEFADITFAAEPELLDQMVVKGSIAVDGISLTIADVNGYSFRAAVIPQTLEKTTLGRARIGDRVNIETDIFAKIIRKQLQKMLSQREKLTVEKLEQLGF